MSKKDEIQKLNDPPAPLPRGRWRFVRPTATHPGKELEACPICGGGGDLVDRNGIPYPCSGCGGGGERLGFTLIELMIVIAIIGILVSIAIPAIEKREAASAAAERTAAMKYAREWCAHAGKITDVSCVSEDTDGDKYVSCTCFLEDRTPIGIECAYYRSEGCRLPKVRTP